MEDFSDKISNMIGAEDVASKGSQPAPVHLWDPELSGDIDIVVKRDGSWWHEGGEIKRPEIVKTFSNILKREGDDYFLVTPVEKWRINVEDAPFIVIRVDQQEGESGSELVMTTKTGERFTLGAEHPLEVTYLSGFEGEPSPYALVRTNLKALIARSVFYELAELAEFEAVAGSDDSSESQLMVVYSGGQKFVLGQI